MNKLDWKYLAQKYCLRKKDNSFYGSKIVKLRDKIIKETGWLAGETRSGGVSSSLAFHDQAIKYYEYKNMMVQRRSQNVIIFLSIVLLIMTGFQIYLAFFL